MSTTTTATEVTLTLNAAERAAVEKALAAVAAKAQKTEKAANAKAEKAAARKTAAQGALEGFKLATERAVQSWDGHTASIKAMAQGEAIALRALNRFSKLK